MTAETADRNGDQRGGGLRGGRGGLRVSATPAASGKKLK